MTPLAERMRPTDLDHYIGQQHLVGEGAALRRSILANTIPSIIFWGPPGVGKTTLALLISKLVQSDFIQLSAISSGVKDVREAISKAEYNLKRKGRKTILFIDVTPNKKLGNFME